VPPWLVYLGGGAWAALLFWRALNGASQEPVDWLERAYGLVALQLIVAGLAVTPLRRFAGLNLLRFRRALGLTAFFFVAIHFTVWAVLDVQSLAAVWADIVKRPYVTVGMGALVLLIPLAATSNNLSLRRLGAASWRRLHWLTYR
jgi:sulfoxide reductase heme-binding subunit YedZ